MNGPDPDDELLTPREVAAIFGVSAVTIGRWARTGVLKPAMRTPGGQRRYRRADVRAQAQQESGFTQMERDAVRLYEQGWPIRRVAEEFGCTYGRMRLILLRHSVLRP